MADISQIKLPDNNTYNFKDTLARDVKMYYGLCTSAADTAAKVVTVGAEQDFKLTVGALLMVKFTKSNSASNVTLNVNSTGAKGIYYNNAVYTGNSTSVCGYANANFIYMYGGSNWIWVGRGANTTYNAMSVAEGQTATGTNSRTMRADYLKQIIQYHAVPSGQGVPAGGTAGQVLAKVDGTNYNTEWIDAPGGGDMIFYSSSSSSETSPKASEFVYPGDVDFEFYLESTNWNYVSSDMKALLPSVDLPPYKYYYKQKKMTNSSGTYLLKTARWYNTGSEEYIDFTKFPNSVWVPTGMNIYIGKMVTTTPLNIDTSTNFAAKLKAIKSNNHDLIHGYLETYSGTVKNYVHVTGIVRSETEFEFQTYFKTANGNDMYFMTANYNAGTWVIRYRNVGAMRA